MNILHINDKVTISGGVEVYLEQLTALSPKYKINSYWLGLNKEAKGYRFEEYNDYRNKYDSLSFKQLLAYLKHFIEKHRVDIIHIHSISDSKIINACFQLAPVVRSMHEPRMICPGQGKFWRKSDMICTQKFGLHCLYHAYSQGCCNRNPQRLFPALFNSYYEVYSAGKKYSAIIAMSDFMKAEAIKAGICASQIVVNPLFTEKVSLSNSQNESKTKRILFIGRLSRTKGVHYLIKVAKHLLTKHDNLLFDIVGDGHDAGYFKSLVPDSLKEFIVFHGWQSRDQINEHLRNTYLMAFTSIYPEAFGISGIEALMHGKPVVGFDVGGVSTWLKDGETGFLIPPKNTKVMSEKINELLLTGDLYNKISGKAREYAITNFTPDNHYNRLINIYKDVTASN